VISSAFRVFKLDYKQDLRSAEGPGASMS
jgi:hypothetical protein